MRWKQRYSGENTLRPSTKWFRRIESGADVQVRCGLKLSVGGGSSPVWTPKCGTGLNC